MKTLISGFVGCTLVMANSLFAQQTPPNEIFKVKPVISIDLEETNHPFPNMPTIEPEASAQLRPNHMRRGQLIVPQYSDNALGYGIKLYSGHTLNLSIDKGLEEKVAKDFIKSWENEGEIQFHELIHGLRTGEMTCNTLVQQAPNRKCYLLYNASDHSGKNERGISTFNQILKIKDRNNHYVRIEGKFEANDVSTIFYLANEMKELDILKLPLYDLIQNSSMDRMGISHGKKNKMVTYFFSNKHLTLTKGKSNEELFGYDFEKAIKELVRFLEFEKIE
ncbi:MAG: hypothetical protein R8N23_10595 [Reichenbachiella sp.]|uniref:hypothetical protein n=1 Tax=Reichenbachiella sp. TaxID=2184521 RepID=UPI0029666A2C|nr:hypothetical protein [Reichenbachiella sp.]MDW3210307.1 hypothetical protein [Reichenbachiella sp.]